MPIGRTLDAPDAFRAVLGRHYKIERDRCENCLGDIIAILDNSDEEHKQVLRILERLTTHYSRNGD